MYPGASFRALRHEFIPYLQSETKHHLRNFHAGLKQDRRMSFPSPCSAEGLLHMVSRFAPSRSQITNVGRTKNEKHWSFASGSSRKGSISLGLLLSRVTRICQNVGGNSRWAGERRAFPVASPSSPVFASLDPLVSNL